MAQSPYPEWPVFTSPRSAGSTCSLTAAGRLVLLSLPTSSPWLNPLEMRWRRVRRRVTHCERYGSVKALLAAAADFSARYNRELWGITNSGSGPVVVMLT